MLDDAGRARCRCGRPASDKYRKITGWERLRDQGGANAIIDRRDTGERICAECMIELRHKVPAGSLHLF